MELLTRTNPLEDLGRILMRPLTFSAQLATDESVVSDWPLAKAIGFYLFATALVSIASFAPNATLTADVLGFISEKLRPIYEQLGLHSSDVSVFETLAFFGVRLHGEYSMFMHLMRNFCGVLLLAALMSLVWPQWGFRRLLCWTCYAHWFVILDLLTGFGLFTGILTTLFLSRITLEAEGRMGIWNILNRWTIVGLLGLFVSFVGLSLT
ncbi:MAG: hypothetical protein ABIR96_07485 [Bdellovibrionota bacterium]